VTFTVYGLPQPKGSMKYIGHHGGKPRLKSTSKGLPAWDEAVQVHAAKACGTKAPPYFDGPVRVDIVFTCPRPKKAKDQRYPVTKPDLDKLTRAIYDALKQAGVFIDDSYVCASSIAKHFPLMGYAIGQSGRLDRPGCTEHVEAL
jgi:Holliday junction resolvase RusA-like endonuclease